MTDQAGETVEQEGTEVDDVADPEVSGAQVPEVDPDADADTGAAPWVSLVTGAAAGIGRAVAIELAGRGDRLVLVDVNGEALDEVVAEVRATGGEALALVGSVADPELAGRSIAAAVATFGRLDHLVNCAGVLDGYARIEEVEPDFLRRVVEIDVFGAVYFCRAAVGPMVAAGHGRIVNIASVASHVGSAGGTAYSIAKHALIGLTRNLASTHGRFGIRTSAVCPGVVLTDLRRNSEQQLGDFDVDMYRGIGAATEDTFRRLVPLGYAGEPRDIAGCVAFLCSPAGDYINGASLVVDGGFLVHRG